VSGRPGEPQVSSLGIAAEAALAVASRKASGLMAIPLPATEITIRSMRRASEVVPLRVEVKVAVPRLMPASW